MRNVCKQRGKAYHLIDLELISKCSQLVAERTPPHVGLKAANQNDLAVADGRKCEARRRPVDATSHAVDQTNRWSVHLVVVVVLWINRRERSCLPLALEMLDGVGGCIGRVVPTFEGRNHRALPSGAAGGRHTTSVCPDGRRAGELLSPAAGGVDDQYVARRAVADVGRHRAEQAAGEAVQ